MNRGKNKSFHSDWFKAKELHNFLVLIPERLYFVASSTDYCPPDTGKYHFFQNDDYTRSNKVRGRGGDKKYEYEPLDLGCLVDFIRDVNEKLSSVQYQNKVIVHHACAYDFKKYDDAALLIGTYAVKKKKKSKCYNVYFISPVLYRVFHSSGHSLSQKGLTFSNFNLYLFIFDILRIKVPLKCYITIIISTLFLGGKTILVKRKVVEHYLNVECRVTA